MRVHQVLQGTRDLIFRLADQGGGRGQPDRRPLPHGLDRYQFHDLLRVYAAERANADEPAEGRRGGVGRLLSWYVHTADAAGQVVSPYRYKTELNELERRCQPLSFTSADRALSWYDEERVPGGAGRPAPPGTWSGPDMVGGAVSYTSRRGLHCRCFRHVMLCTGCRNLWRVFTSVHGMAFGLHRGR